jgi:hypothetical protein
VPAHELTGAIVVSTPQDVALLDARKALSMFQQLKTPVLGLIENMSTYICPNCGHEAHIFGQGGVAAEAKGWGCRSWGRSRSASTCGSRAIPAPRSRRAMGRWPKPTHSLPAGWSRAGWPDRRRGGIFWNLRHKARSPAGDSAFSNCVASKSALRTQWQVKFYALRRDQAGMIGPSLLPQMLCI